MQCSGNGSCSCSCLSICLFTCKLGNKAILQGFFHFRRWHHQNRSNSARLPQFSKLTTSKTKQFCETSSIFEVDNIKNEAILRDLLQKWNIECRADGLVPMRFAIFSFHRSIAPATNQWCQIIRSAAPVTQNHLSKPDNLTRQKATSLRKSAAWPPNISAAPAMRNASLQILFKSPRPANIFESATKPSRFPHFWQGAKSLAPATRHDIWTSKSGPGPWVFGHFWLGNVLRATMACTFSTFQLLKVLRCWGVLYILTSTCASRQNCVQFFISHLARWLRTRRCSDPTARNSGDNSLEKNTVIRDFSTFSPTCIFFLLTLSLLWSSFFFPLIVYSYGMIVMNFNLSWSFSIAIC